MDNKKIKDAIASQPNAFPVMIAKQLCVSEWSVVSQLSTDFMQEIPVSSFDKIMEDVSKWGDVTFIVSNSSIIAEIKATIPKGSYGNGYFNLAHGLSPIGGHICTDNIAHICFVQKDVMGMESFSIQFFNKEGEGVFKIYLARAENKQIISEQKNAYLNLKNNLSKK